MKNYIWTNALSEVCLRWLDGREYISHRPEQGEVLFIDVPNDSERSYEVSELMETPTHYVGWSVSTEKGDVKSIIVPKPVGDDAISWYTEEEFFRSLAPVEFDGTELENSILEAWLRTMPRVTRGDFLAWAESFSEIGFPGTREALNWIQDKY